jgi:tetratricopeptide (TPR) repeat protein
MNQSDFIGIAPYLNHPLVLIGFVLILFFGMVKALMEAGILPKLSRKDGGIVVLTFLRYGFLIALLITSLGFGLQYYKLIQESSTLEQQSKKEESANINAIVQTLIAKHQRELKNNYNQLQVKDDQIKPLTDAVIALSKGQVDASPSMIKDALAALDIGDTTLAKNLFEKTAKAGEQNDHGSAVAYRHLGALASRDDTKKALQAYKHAIELDPNDANSRKQLAYLLELNKAKTTYQEDTPLGEQIYHQGEPEIAYRMLQNEDGSKLGTDQSKNIKPSVPLEVLPDLRSGKITVACISCPEPFFVPEAHNKILESLVNNSYIGELRKALYFQDSLHQLESKAHFDNCDFDGAIAYIDSLIEEVNEHVNDAQKAKNTGDFDIAKAAVHEAFFAIGQALHAVQDFYAHSNYVELTEQSVNRVTDLEVIAPWRSEGKTRIKQLRQNGGKDLVSGYVFWGFPQLCPSGSISHADLAKDSETTTSGKVKVANLQNLSQYRIAVYLAREASIEFLQDAFKRWPLLEELNGPNVAFEVLVDFRKFAM